MAVSAPELIAWSDFGVAQPGVGLSLGGSLAGLFLLLVGVIIMWASRLLLASLAFWAPGLELSILYSSWWQLGRYPITIYPGAIRWVLTYLVPVAFIATFPAYALTRGADPLLLLGGALAATAALLLVAFFWRAGLRRYTSATS